MGRGHIRDQLGNGHDARLVSSGKVSSFCAKCSVSLIVSCISIKEIPKCPFLHISGGVFVEITQNLFRAAKAVYRRGEKARISSRRAGGAAAVARPCCPGHGASRSCPFTSGRISCPAWMSAYRYAPSVPENTASGRRTSGSFWRRTGGRTPSPSSGAVMTRCRPCRCIPPLCGRRPRLNRRRVPWRPAARLHPLHGGKDASGFYRQRLPDLAGLFPAGGGFQRPLAAQQSSRTPSRNFCQPMNFTRLTGAGGHMGAAAGTQVRRETREAHIGLQGFLRPGRAASSSGEDTDTAIGWGFPRCTG